MMCGQGCCLSTELMPSRKSFSQKTGAETSDKQKKGPLHWRWAGPRWLIGPFWVFCSSSNRSSVHWVTWEQGASQTWQEPKKILPFFWVSLEWNTENVVGFVFLAKVWPKETPTCWMANSKFGSNLRMVRPREVRRHPARAFSDPDYVFIWPWGGGIFPAPNPST